MWILRESVEGVWSSIFSAMFSSGPKALRCHCQQFKPKAPPGVTQKYPNQNSRKEAFQDLTARMAAIGFVMGPMLHCFYRVLDSRAFRGDRRKVVFKKLCCDAACMPIFSCTFITVGGLLEGSSLSSAFSEYRKKMWHIFKVDVSIWPPAQLISFWFLPPSVRQLNFSNVLVLLVFKSQLFEIQKRKV
ncbi:Mpv17 / PMP22 family protein [Ancylostoma ceylanicum]|uniref:Mpv17 / PMP22 family protein n=1 Tax=Ancylostoma ceylanicum TaxID=53326 RepID=A0A0D6LZB1_9BILA|nr:Mpv17 / PMP22 family protein [Ancylostoma ceylanicum]